MMGGAAAPGMAMIVTMMTADVVTTPLIAGEERVEPTGISQDGAATVVTI